MHPLYDEFAACLDAEDKDAAVRFALRLLEDRKLDVPTLYNELLTPSLYADFCAEAEEDICIWKEHVRTSIIRTIIESCYPYVIAERDAAGRKQDKEVVVLCPPEEWHDLGARMVADFFTLAGFRTTFVGANTPRDDIIYAVRHLKPAYVAISITNYYNLVAARHVLGEICELRGSLGFKVILGGQACRVNEPTCRGMKPDFVLDTSADIMKLGDA